MEFTCKKGHVMNLSMGLKCHICGELVYKMDNMSIEEYERDLEKQRQARKEKDLQK